jgi:hypothetical protein
VAAARDAAGLDNAFIDAAFGFNGMAGHWTSQRSQPAVPTIEQVPELFDLLGVEPPPEIARLLWELNSRKGQPGPNWWKREKVGERTTGIGTGMGPTPIIGDTENRDITAPATPEAQAWDGWGTALKPAWEPIVVARKPVSGTVAQNVLAFGTGGLNIDGCRIDASLEDMASQLRANTPSSFRYVDTDSVAYSQMVATGRDHDPTKGRWPANLALDEHAARMLDAQSRFFYVAKASRGEREAGLREAGLREAEAFADGLSRDMNTANSGNPIPRARNHHPTVKPVELMRWLVRLVTPPGGLVLDPFMGSGSTGCAAVLEGFRFVGLDIDPEYVRIAKARIAQWIIKRDLPEPAVQTFTNKDHRQLSMFGEEAKS